MANKIVGSLQFNDSDPKHMSDTLDCFLAENERQAFRMAQLATGHNDDALDIVQDAMIKLVQKYSDRDPLEWGPLFHRILQRQIIDWYRSTSIKRRIFSWFEADDKASSGSYLDGLADPADTSPDRLLQDHQVMDLLQSALKTLPLRQRQVFLLRCWQGLSTKQTSEAMGCSTGSVKTHYHRALTTLRSQLGETWP